MPQRSDSNNLQGNNNSQSHSKSPHSNATQLNWRASLTEKDLDTKSLSFSVTK